MTTPTDNRRTATARWVRGRLGALRPSVLVDRGEDRLEMIEGDVQDVDQVAEGVAGIDVVYHLAAQVAVTTSLEEPTRDIDVNARGTLNVLEAVRKSGTPSVSVKAAGA